MQTLRSLSLPLLLIAGACWGQASPTANSDSKLDQSPVFIAADTNKDGKVSKAEWAAVKGGEPLFGAMDTNKDDVLNLAELNASSPPVSADINKDGKLSVQEFQTIPPSDGTPPSNNAAPPQGPPPAPASK